MHLQWQKPQKWRRAAKNYSGLTWYFRWSARWLKENQEMIWDWRVLERQLKTFWLTTLTASNFGLSFQVILGGEDGMLQVYKNCKTDLNSKSLPEKNTSVQDCHWLEGDQTCHRYQCAQMTTEETNQFFFLLTYLVRVWK